MALEVPMFEYASSINPPIFHRLRVSKRCVGEYSQILEKDISHEQSQG